MDSSHAWDDVSKFLEASRRRRHSEPTLALPPDAQITFAHIDKLLGVVGIRGGAKRFDAARMAQEEIVPRTETL